MKKIKIIVLFVVLFVSYGLVHSSSNDIQIDKNLLKKNILKISLPDVFPKHLEIITPDHQTYVLQDDTQGVELYPQKEFEKLSEITLDMNTLVGTTWKDSKKIKEKIFTESGNYTIYFANELETEIDNSFSLKKVIYYEKR